MKYHVLDPDNPCNRADTCTMSATCANYRENCTRVGVFADLDAAASQLREDVLAELRRSRVLRWLLR